MSASGLVDAERRRRKGRLRQRAALFLWRDLAQGRRRWPRSRPARSRLARDQRRGTTTACASGACLAASAPARRRSADRSSPPRTMSKGFGAERGEHWPHVDLRRGARGAEDIGDRHVVIVADLAVLLAAGAPRDLNPIGFANNLPEDDCCWRQSSAAASSQLWKRRSLPTISFDPVQPSLLQLRADIVEDCGGDVPRRGSVARIIVTSAAERGPDEDCLARSPADRAAAARRRHRSADCSAPAADRSRFHHVPENRAQSLGIAARIVSANSAKSRALRVSP